jgi:SAM-dependent methyltransferase
MLELSRQEQARRRYQAQRPGWRPAGDVLNALLEPLLLPHVRALDAGCGRWGVLGRFQERVGLAVGVDADFPSLRENRILPLRAQARLEALPFPARTFDLILCTWVIEHLPEPRAAFQEIARVLKPGGHLLLLTPNARHPLVALGRAIPSRWRRPLVRPPLRPRAPGHLPHLLSRQHAGGAAPPPPRGRPAGDRLVRGRGSHVSGLPSLPLRPRRPLRTAHRVAPPARVAPSPNRPVRPPPCRSAFTRIKSLTRYRRPTVSPPSPGRWNPDRGAEVAR